MLKPLNKGGSYETKNIYRPPHPTISVSASYTGANAETVQKSVVVPLEEAINGVENMLYMTSTSTNTGSGSIMVYFNQGTDPDMATVNVKNRVAEAEGLLPAEVTKVGVTVQKRQNSMLKILAFPVSREWETS